MSAITKRILAVLLTAALTAVCLSGCYFLPEEEATLQPPLKEPEAVTYQTYTVTSGTLERWLEGNGSLVTTASEEIQYTQQGGHLKEICVKAGQEVHAGDLICELYTDDLEDQLYYAENDLYLAKLSYYEACSASGDNNYAIARAKVAMEEAQHKYDALNEQWENARLYASIDGTVTYIANLRDGDVVSTFQRIVTISDTSELRVKLVTDDIGELSIGQELTVTEPSTGAEGVAKVVQLPEERDNELSAEGKKTALLEIISLDVPAGKKVPMSLGSSFFVKVLLESKENVIFLPAKYISTYNNRKYVRILVDGMPEERDVTLGILGNGNCYEILTGLEAGDEVIT